MARRLLDALTRVALIAILPLVLAVQIQSALNVHPDEFKHAEAAGYYVAHWLAPAIGEPGIFRSAYGTTYLEELDIAYVFYGKFAALIAPLALEPPLPYRLFNFVLLALMVAALQWRGLDPSLSVFLLTSQLWYVFSYVSGEALPLFLSFACVALAAAIRERVRSEDDATPHFAALGLVIGLLTIGKASFHPLLLFLAAAAALELLRERTPAVRTRLVRGLALAGVLAVCVFGLRFGIDYTLNGPERRAQIRESNERYAQVPFKRGTPVEERFQGRLLREAGVPLGALLRERKWHVGSYESFVGLYGYLSHPSSRAFYAAMGLLLSILLVAILALPIRAGERDALLLSTLLVLGLGVTLLASLGRSWTHDFQAQGRYLFAIVPMLGYRIAASERLRESSLVRTLILACLLCSLYSFARFGLLPLSRGS
jgi:hypothetical protein